MGADVQEIAARIHDHSGMEYAKALIGAQATEHYLDGAGCMPIDDQDALGGWLINWVKHLAYDAELGMGAAMLYACEAVILQIGTHSPFTKPLMEAITSVGTYLAELDRFGVVDA
jgi:hypothetical protein